VENSLALLLNATELVRLVVPHIGAVALNESNIARVMNVGYN
jgi:hypothetical protein